MADKMLLQPTVCLHLLCVVTAQQYLNFLDSGRDELSASTDATCISDVLHEINLPDLTVTPTVLVILLGTDPHTCKDTHIIILNYMQSCKIYCIT